MEIVNEQITKSFFVDMSSFARNQSDPRGTLLVIKGSKNEIGIHVSESNTIEFSLHPPKGAETKLQMSIDEIAKLIKSNGKVETVKYEITKRKKK